MKGSATVRPMSRSEEWAAEVVPTPAGLGLQRSQSTKRRSAARRARWRAGLAASWMLGGMARRPDSRGCRGPGRNGDQRARGRIDPMTFHSARQRRLARGTAPRNALGHHLSPQAHGLAHRRRTHPGCRPGRTAGHPCRRRPAQGGRRLSRQVFTPASPTRWRTR